MNLILFFKNILNKKHALMYLCGGVGWFVLNSCGPSGNQPNVELIQDMMDQPALKAQKADSFFSSHQPSSLLPPEHTQPRGKPPYPYTQNLDQALKNLKNPIADDLSDSILLMGQKQYYTHCLVCHGEKGKGDGPIKNKFPLPIPSLVSDKVKSMKDAHIYHIITVGQGVMGSYASQVPESSRWSLVNYIRYLQKND